MYIILTTFPEKGSGNVGDKLITSAAIEILKQVKGETEFVTLFREEDLSPHLDIVNQSRAVIMPGFPIRHHTYPNIFRLVSNLEMIKVPLIPMGANWSSYPGDLDEIGEITFSEDTTRFVRYIASRIDLFSYREYVTGRILKNNGITNGIMVGDCAWYDLTSLGKPFQRPSKVERIVFTTPHYPQYVEQAKSVVSMLSELFPQADKYCAMQSLPTAHEAAIADYAMDKGFVIREVSHEVEKITFYKDCDLHVGYRVHGHIAFLRKRIPSILVNEDSRGIGFSYSLGVGGFNATSRRFVVPTTGIRTLLKQSVHLMYTRKILREKNHWPGQVNDIITVDMTLARSIRNFLEEELESGFRRYLGLSNIIDDTYEVGMVKFLETVP